MATEAHHMRAANVFLVRPNRTGAGRIRTKSGKCLYLKTFQLEWSSCLLIWVATNKQTAPSCRTIVQFCFLKVAESPPNVENAPT
jgi:hypothetical protein